MNSEIDPHTAEVIAFMDEREKTIYFLLFKYTLVGKTLVRLVSQNNLPKEVVETAVKDAIESLKRNYEDAEVDFGPSIQDAILDFKMEVSKYLP